MSVSTNNEKLAIMELEDWWEPGLPLSPGALGQNDKQQLILGYPGVLWGAGLLALALRHQGFLRNVARLGRY